MPVKIGARYAAALQLGVGEPGQLLVVDRLAQCVGVDGQIVRNPCPRGFRIAGNNWRKRRGALTELLSTSDFAAGVAWWQAKGAAIGTDAYTFSKEAVVLYTMQLAGRGLTRGIRVNDVGPGPVETPIFPDFEQMTGRDMMQSYISMVGRVGKPDDIADAIVVLAEGEIGWLNGQHIVVDGGLTAGFSAGWKTGR